MRVSKRVLAGWLAVVSAPAVAAPEPEPDPRQVVVAIKDTRVAAEVCRDVRLPPAHGRDAVASKVDAAVAGRRRKAVLERVYAAEFAADRFKFTDYDGASGLAVDAQRGFFTLRGGLGIWSSEAEPLEFPMDAEAARQALALHGRGGLTMRLVFHLDADPDEADSADTLASEPCATRPGTDSYQMAVTYLAGELLETKGGKRLGSFVTEKGKQTPVVAQSFLGDAQLRVGSPDTAVEGGGALVAQLESRREALQKCYAEHGGRAEGGLAVGLDLDRAGAVSGVGIDVSSIDSDELAKCVVSVVKAGAPIKGPPGQHITLPLVWGRE